MTFLPPFAWALVIAIALLAAVYAIPQLRAALRRRARRKQYRQEAEAHAAAPQPPAGAPAIPPEHIAAISTDAQEAAWRVAHGVEPHASNPHPARTREFVLWEATFHSAMSDFAELAEEAQATEEKPRETR